VRKRADGLLLQVPSEHGIVHPDGSHLRFQDGTCRIDPPGKPYMAVLAVRESKTDHEAGKESEGE
jgi:hypothetical protein